MYFTGLLHGFIVDMILTLSLLSVFFSEKMNESFYVENASRFYDNFNKKILIIFLLKLSYKNSWVKFDAFSTQKDHLYFSKMMS